MAMTEQEIVEGMPPRLDKDAPSGRINVVATDALLQHVEEWRARQRPIPNKSEAARQLIEWALDEMERRLQMPEGR